MTKGEKFSTGRIMYGCKTVFYGVSSLFILIIYSFAQEMYVILLKITLDEKYAWKQFAYVLVFVQ